MLRGSTPWLVGLVAAGAVLLAVALIVPAEGPGEVERADSTVGGPPVSTTGTVIDALQGIGGPADLEHLIGERMELTVDIGQAVNDVAFWIGPYQSGLLVVMNRGTRSGRERQLGLPSTDTEFTPLPRGLVTVRGRIEPLPYAEAMYSWGLTRRDVALAQERGVYLLVDELVSPAPFVLPRRSAETIDEFGRETAPPPGEQVETPLNLPPPPP